MTAPKRSLFGKIKGILRALPQPIDAISSVVGRLFSPSDDDYPETGVQPFSGDAPDDRQQHLP
jgi:hypothetical protein